MEPSDEQRAKNAEWDKANAKAAERERLYRNDPVTRVKPVRNAVVLEIVRDGTRPIVHVECKDEGARPQLEELARRVLFQIALRP